MPRLKYFGVPLIGMVWLVTGAMAARATSPAPGGGGYTSAGGQAASGGHAGGGGHGSEARAGEGDSKATNARGETRASVDQASRAEAFSRVSLSQVTVGGKAAVVAAMKGPPLSKESRHLLRARGWTLHEMAGQTFYCWDRHTGDTSDRPRDCFTVLPK